jgi:hypothetical protein
VKTSCGEKFIEQSRGGDRGKRWVSDGRAFEGLVSDGRAFEGLVSDAGLDE